MRIINWDIASHPANWLIVFLVVFITAAGASMLFGRALPGPRLQS